MTDEILAAIYLVVAFAVYLFLRYKDLQETKYKTEILNAESQALWSLAWIFVGAYILLVHLPARLVPRALRGLDKLIIKFIRRTHGHSVRDKTITSV